jgi:3-dehydroquinate dehydratase II
MRHSFKAAPFMAAILLLLAFVATSLSRPTQQRRATSVPKLKILVIHGPNMNLLGRREPQIYGTMTLDQINAQLDILAEELNVQLIKMQTNHEGVIVDTFQAHIDDVDGAIINAAGLSFHSVPIHDVIKAMPFPVIEVHMSNLGSRDAIHQNSILTAAVRGTIMGLGWHSYTAALRGVVEIVREEKASKTQKRP